MKLVAQRNVLYEALGMVAGVVPQKSPKPILQNVLIDVKAGGKGMLLATDLEVGMRVAFTAKGSEAGKAVLSASRILGILRETPEDAEVTLKVEGERAELRAVGEFTLVGAPVDEFPDVPEFGEAAMSVPAEELARALGRVLFAVSREQTRYAINGVSMKVSGKELEFAATDGKRLSVATVKVPGKKKPPQASVILPSKMVGELVKLASGRGEDAKAEEEGEGRQEAQPSEVELAIDGSEIFARAGACTVVGRLVEGSFPRYEEVVPPAGPNRLKVSVEEFARAIRQASVVTTEDSRGLRFKLTSRGVTIEARSAEVGTAAIPVPGDYQGSDLEIAFDGRYVADGLKVLSAAETVLEFDTAERPLVVREGREFTYVVMPMKV
jgi:DNA polymerase-3 subunit beta